MRIAVIGAGISGLGAAWLLSARHEVVVYEANGYAGGHSNTVDVPRRDGQVPVDTGFIVYNERNYPHLTRLFTALQVPTEPSNMSFSVQVPARGIEWAGTSLLTVFGQPRNLLRPAFRRMVGDILRFNRQAAADLLQDRLGSRSLGDYLDGGGYGAGFREWYLLPMGAAIWSGSLDGMQAYPAVSILRFLHNHGLLTVNDQPKWRTVSGGSREYVRRLTARFADGLRLGTPVGSLTRRDDAVLVRDTEGHEDRFDQAVLATHANQALRLLADPDPAEREVLSVFRYQHNRAVLHCDPSPMPARRRLWSSWNYLAGDSGPGDGASCTYWMNRLQNIEPSCPLFVTLNPSRPLDEDKVIAAFDYSHPQYDARAVSAQARLPALQGRRRTWFCGSYHGYGFHEDGLASAVRIAEGLGSPPPWLIESQPAAAPNPAAAVTQPAGAGD